MVIGGAQSITDRAALSSDKTSQIDRQILDQMDTSSGMPILPRERFRHIHSRHRLRDTLDLVWDYLRRHRRRICTEMAGMGRITEETRVMGSDFPLHPRVTTPEDSKVTKATRAKGMMIVVIDRTGMIVVAVVTREATECWWE